MERTSLTDFELKRIKVKSGTITFKAVTPIIEDNVIIKPVIDDKWPVEPHEDLRNELNKLVRPLAHLTGYLDFETIITNEDFKATPEQKEYLRKQIELNLSKIEITGISISGINGNVGIVITGVREGIAINSKKVKFSGTAWGFEEDLKTITDAIVRESYEFIFNGKKGKLSQLNLFEKGDQEGEDHDKEEAADTLID